MGESICLLQANKAILGVVTRKQSPFMVGSTFGDIIEGMTFKTKYADVKPSKVQKLSNEVR
jgi:hypothetical protein